MTTNQTGRPVRGGDFFDREWFIPELWTRIIEGENILLLAPRRVGKSSVMFQLVDHAKSKGFQTLMVSVAGARSETDFIREIISALDALQITEATQVLKSLLRKAKWLRRVRKFSLLGGALEVDDLGKDWKIAADDLWAALAELTERWLILIDELPIFVHRMIRTADSPEDAEVFLSWFRDLRTAESAPKKVQWFLAGSIGLDTVTRQANLGDTINDLHKETRLGPFEVDVAHRFLEELGKHYGLSMDVATRTHFLSKIQWLIPYYIQLLFSEVRNLVNKGTSPTKQQIDAAYEQLLSPQKRSAFDFWVQRLTKELPPPLNTLALLLLDTVAIDDEGVTRQVLSQAFANKVSDPDERQLHLDFLLQVLQTDGYLVQESESFLFRSALLKDFWRRSRIQ